jgi:hypothetical protein
MLRLRQIATVGVIILGVCLLLRALQSDYLRFTGRSADYYREFAAACELLLQQHPIGTNDWAYKHGHKLPQNAIQLPRKDPTVPKIIRALGPEDIILSSNRVHIAVGVGRGGFGIVWEQDRGESGWSLRTYAEGLEKKHYEVIKYRPGHGS